MTKEISSATVLANINIKIYKRTFGLFEKCHIFLIRYVSETIIGYVKKYLFIIIAVTKYISARIQKCSMVKVVYMVAGMSSRFGGKVKQLAPIGVNGETLIELSLHHALEQPFSEIIFIVGNKTEKIFKEMFGEVYRGIPVKYARQNFDPQTRDKPWGTTDALVSAAEYLNEPFVLLNGDDLYGKETFRIACEALEEHNDAITIGYDLWSVMPEKGEVNRGTFDVEDGYVQSITENFKISKATLEERGIDKHTLANLNFFGFQQESITDFKEILERFKKEHEGSRTAECILPIDAGELIRNGKMKMKIYSTPSNWYGLTNPEDEEIVRNQLKEDPEYN